MKSSLGGSSSTNGGRSNFLHGGGTARTVTGAADTTIQAAPAWPVGKLGAGPEGERQAQRVYATCNGRAVGALCPVWPLQSITMRPCSAELGDTPGASSMAGFNPVDDDACSDSAAVAW